MKPNIAKSAARPLAGFSLLELVIYVAIVGVVLSAAALFAVHFVTTQRKAETASSAVRNAQFALDRIEAETAESTGINVGASTFGSNPGTLSLATSNVSTNPTVFTVTDGRLTMQQGANSPVPLTEAGISVTDFTLENLTPHGRSQYVRVRIRTALPSTSGFADVDASAEVESTFQVRRSEGFTYLRGALRRLAIGL